MSLPARPWSLTGPAVLDALGTRASGLSEQEAATGLARFGPNRIHSAQWQSGIVRALRQFANPLILVLIAAAAISWFLGERTEAAVILAILVVNALLGFAQEYRAERALRRLSTFITRTATVRREGALRSVPLEEVVPGDIVHIEMGDVIPADVRFLAVDELTTDESALTGESAPVEKYLDPVDTAAPQPYQLTSMGLMGTAVSSGFGEGVVVATGTLTHFGHAATLIGRRPRETDFQKNIRGFSDYLLRVMLVLTGFVFLANALIGKGFFDSFLFALALAVGITPEALPVIVTVSLSNGALRMARDKVVAKRLSSVEDLGNVDVLCCDKTGTLTEGDVSLHDYVGLDGARSPEVLVAGLLTSAPAAAGGAGANPVDRAMQRRAGEVAEEFARYRLIDRNAFDARRRRSSALVSVADGSRRLYVKGACEAVLAACDTADPRVESARPWAATLERAGYRVLAVAERPAGEETSRSVDESGLTLLGFLLFLDPPKPGVSDSLAELTALGVGLNVMSGDSSDVTRQVCDAVGLAVRGGRVVTGPELEGLETAALADIVARYNVFARVSPEQKARLVEALAAAGHVVGFLGDGVNDAPALRLADVGIAVDSGTDIAKEAADIVLLQKSLRVLARGIREGRKTFSNINKYILNTISANFGNMATVALSSLALGFIPLLPSQILLNNLVSDLPLVTISTDRVDEELLQRPRRWDLGLISRFMIVFGLLSAAFDILLIVGLLWGLKASPGLFRTAWFVESACSEILITFAIRTALPFYRSRPSSLLLGASLVTAVATFLLPFTDLGVRYFQFEPMPSSVVWLIVAVLVAYFLSAEVAKRRFFRSAAA